MATEFRLRRGSSHATEQFTGADGEVTVDTTKNTLVVHDGKTPGGHRVAKASDLDAARIEYAPPSPTLPRRAIEEKLRETVSVEDLGVSRNAFDVAGNSTAFSPAGAEAEARNIGGRYRVPVLGSTHYLLPNLALKLWYTPDGVRDRGAAVSISIDNQDGRGSEPWTQVNGFKSHSDVGRYKDRDFVGLYVSHVMLPSLASSNRSTFTATSVTLADISPERLAEIKQGMLVDVVSRPDKYTGVVTGIDQDRRRLSVSAWYVVSGSDVVRTVTPAAGLLTTIRPNTKAWAVNTNLIRTKQSAATQGAGYEMGLLDEVGSNISMYGFDCVNLGKNKLGAGFQTRGSFEVAFAAYEGSSFGYVSKQSTVIGHFDAGSTVGFQSAGASADAFVAKTPGRMALNILTEDNRSLASIDRLGVRRVFKEASQVIRTGGTASHPEKVNDECVVCLTVATQGKDRFVLPATNGNNTNRRITLLNLPTPPTTTSATFSGPIAGGGDLIIAPGQSCDIWSDGSTWYKIPGLSAV